MRIFIASDSHNNQTALQHAILKEAPDAIIHLGDGYDDLPKNSNTPIYQVCGNCDSIFCALPEKRVIELDGVRILITHGQKYNVKFSLSSLLFAAMEEQASLVLFGHTHVPYEDIHTNGISLINPGAIYRAPHRYGMLITSKGEFSYYPRTLV